METLGMTALERPAADLTIMDVYDIAAVLGQEFERIIDRFGCETLVGVVPKVVRVLELLEALVSRGAAGQEAEELREELDRLRQERSDRSEQERKHQKVCVCFYRPDCVCDLCVNIFAYMWKYIQILQILFWRHDFVILLCSCSFYFLTNKYQVVCADT